VAKATCWLVTDAEARKPGEQTGLDTPVVLALNDEHLAVVRPLDHSRSESGKCSAWGVRSQG
jgi:hypothetical protein